MSTGVDDETILQVLRESDDPALTTSEVAELLPITRGTTRTRLQALVDEGLVERERSGRSVVWWLAERDEERTGERADEPEANEPATAGEGAGADEPPAADRTADERPAGASELDEMDPGGASPERATTEDGAPSPEAAPEEGEVLGDGNGEGADGPADTEVRRDAGEASADAGAAGSGGVSPADRDEPRVVTGHGDATAASGRSSARTVGLAVGGLVGLLAFRRLLRRLRR